MKRRVEEVERKPEALGCTEEASSEVWGRGKDSNLSLFSISINQSSRWVVLDKFQVPLNPEIYDPLGGI